MFVKSRKKPSNSNSPQQIDPEHLQEIIKETLEQQLEPLKNELARLKAENERLQTLLQKRQGSNSTSFIPTSNPKNQTKSSVNIPFSTKPKKKTQTQTKKGFGI